MQSHDLSFEFNARYFTLGELNSYTREVWFVLHGYGQLASYFIQKFASLKENNIFVIAPEALSRFYVDPLTSTGRASDRVGASWMTKENRLTDIRNYLITSYVIYTHSASTFNTRDCFWLFSRCGHHFAMGLRRKIAFNRMILWSGILPPDMNFLSAKEILRDKDIVVVYGRRIRSSITTSLLQWRQWRQNLKYIHMW
jgi:hypothetical protein